MILISLALVTQAVKGLLLGVCFSTARLAQRGHFGHFAAIQSLCYLLGQFRCSNNRLFPTSPRTQSTDKWWVGCIGLNGPLRQYFSLYRAVSQRGGERGEMIDERKKWSKQPPPALTASAVGPCPTIILISRTPGTGTTAKCSDKYIGVGRFRILGRGGSKV